MRQIDARWPRGMLCLASRECWPVICTNFVQPLNRNMKIPQIEPMKLSRAAKGDAERE
jgi:hypothetical protein